MHLHIIHTLFKHRMKVKGALKNCRLIVPTFNMIHISLGQINFRYMHPFQNLISHCSATPMLSVSNRRDVRMTSQHIPQSYSLTMDQEKTAALFELLGEILSKYPTPNCTTAINRLELNGATQLSLRNGINTPWRKI